MIFGLLFASWAPRIPALKAKLDIGDAVLGLTLLGPPIGSLVAMPLAGALAARYGSDRITRGGMVVYCAAPALIGVVGSALGLFLALLLWGVGIGLLEVGVNIQATSVEQTYGRPIMASFHGGWSLGALAGAGLGCLLAAAHASLTWSLGLTGLVALAIATLAGRGLVPARGERRPAFVRPRRALLVLSAIAFASYCAEGAVADWSSVYLSDHLSAGGGAAGGGYLAFAVVMTLGRFSGGRVIGRFGPGRTVRFASAVGAAIFAAALVVGSAPAAVVGFAALGAGLCVVVPIVFTAAARQAPGGESAVVAMIATSGLAGFLVGPPAIGALAALLSLPVALGAIVVLTATIAALAPAVDR